MAISLATPQIVSSDEAGASRQLYFSQEVLPDHIAYPALMVMDKIKLSQADSKQKVYVQVQYAYRRLNHAHQLIEKGEEGLATTTITKAQKYLNHALVEGTKNESLSQEDIQYLFDSYQNFYQQVDAIPPSSSIVDNLAVQSDALADILASSLN